MKKKKIVVLTGAGISAESGVKTFRDADGLWEGHDIEQVATPYGFNKNPELVLNFYNGLRKQLKDVQPNPAHLLLAELEKDYNVVVITQNVDDLHESAGSTNVIHLHGELKKACSSDDAYNPEYIKVLTEDAPDVLPGEKAADGSLLRPFIVFFGESVPMIEPAARAVGDADIFVIVGTSLNVYPAAGLLAYVPHATPIYLIDPKPVESSYRKDIVFIQSTASEGVAKLAALLSK